MLKLLNMLLLKLIFTFSPTETFKLLEKEDLLYQEVRKPESHLPELCTLMQISTF